MFRVRRKVTSSKKVDWVNARDIKKRVDNLIKNLNLDWINPEHVHCVRSENSRARAYARIWGMGRVWQETLGLPPKYCIEVLSENFDHLSEDKQDEVLIHELAHIPKTFTGALLPHTHKGKGNFHDKLKTMIAAYKKL